MTGANGQETASKVTGKKVEDFDGGMKQMWVGIKGVGRRGRHGDSYIKSTKR